MENRREEILGLKRLLVGVLVSALLITMLPFESMGTLVTKAAVATPVGDAVFDEYGITATTPIAVGTAQEFGDILSKYTVNEGDTGMILQLTADIDLGSYNGGKINLFAGNVGIDLNGHTITGLYESLILQPEEIQTANLVFIGSMNGSAQGKIISGGWVTETLKYDNGIWQLYDGQNVAFSNVTLEGVDIVANRGASVGDDGIRESVPSSEATETIVCYRQGEGASTYEVITEGSDTYENHTLSMIDFEACTGATTFEISKKSLIEGYVVSEIEYGTSVLGKLPSELIYDNGEYVASYEKPSVGFKVDQEYGFYSVTTEADEEVMTIYGAKGSFTSMNKTPTSDGSELTATSYMRINKNFVKPGTNETYKKVIFAKGAIPGQYRGIDNDDSGYKWTTNTLVEVIISGVSSNTTMEFDLSERDDISVFNGSAAAVTFVDDEDADNKLYVAIMEHGLMEPLYVGDDYLNPVRVNYSYKMNSAGDTQYYALSGSPIVFATEGSYTVYNIQVGDFIPEYDETQQNIVSCTYYNGRRESAENFKFNTDGTVEVIIPNYSFSVCYSASEILDVTYEYEDPYYTVLGTKISEADGGGAYTDVFKIVGTKNNLLWDGLENSNWIEEISIVEEGMYVSKEIYLLDQSMIKNDTDIDGDNIVDTLIPSSTYGKRSFISYMYCLDLQSPVVQDVEVTNQEGEIIEGFPKGSWVEGSSTEVDPEEMYWTNEPYISFTVIPSDTDTSTRIDGYAYSYAENGDTSELPWTYPTEEDSGNIFNISGDGQYKVHFYVRDEFDASFDRAVAGSWVTTFGIDTELPVITYTDAGTTQATNLVENSTHSGNLYLNFTDATSGVNHDSIVIKRVSEDGTVVDCTKEVYVSEGVYCLSQTEKDTIYKIEVADIAGNILSFDNITVAGYVQDISVEMGGASGTYGSELTITGSIMKTGMATLKDVSYAPADGQSEIVFKNTTGTIKEITNDMPVEFSVTLPAGVNAGEYSMILDFNYTSDGGTKESIVSKTYQYKVVAYVDKASGEATISIQSINYGEALTYKVTTPTHSDFEYTVSFRDLNDPDGTYETTEPTEVGSYKILVTYPETDNYYEVRKTAEFMITRLTASADMYVVEESTREDGWYTGPVAITGAEGNTLSLTEDGIFTDRLTINESTESYSFYIKTPSGAITEAATITNINIDATGPVVVYTDANTTSEAELVENSMHEGNLYVSIMDTGIGFESISLYKKIDDKWNASIDALHNADEVGKFFIAPAETDAIYKIVVVDKAGNESIYENVTVKAYTPDMEITTDIDSVEYGVEGLITITIKNTGSAEITNVVYKLNESEVQNAFEALEGTIDSIAVGATATITATTFPNNNLGTYVAPLELTYTSNGTTKETIINKEYSQDISITIEQAEGSGEITIQEMFYYGEKIIYDVASNTNGVSNVTIYFKDADSETAEYSEIVPTEEGNYKVKAVFAETTEYKATTAEGTFTITRMEATEDMYAVVPSDREDGWYKDSIVINGSEGNLLSTTEDGEYSESLAITTEVESFSFYIKTPTGAITQEVTLSNFLIDQTAPIVYVNDEELVSGNIYNETIQLFIKDTGIGIVDLTIQGNAENIVESEDGSYYILQAAQDQTYTIVGEDDLGNVVTYSNITVNAYSQDVEITVSGNTAIYGATEDIIINIKNVGSTTLSNINYTVENAETGNVLSPQSGSIEMINSGETVTIALPLADKVDAGEYLASIEVSYTAYEKIAATNIDKVYTQEVPVTITQAEGTGTVEIQDYYYGEEVSLLVNSDTNGNETYTVYYKNAEDETAEFTQTAPTKAGNYIVRVVFDATTNYKEVIAENTFHVTRLVPTNDMYSYGIETNDTDWILSDVIITAQDGYTISVTEDGTFTDTLTISESVESYTFYVKTETGAVTEAVELGAFKIDKTAPEIAQNEGIYVVKTWWQKFLDVITFNTYQSETEKIEIKAHDNESGMAQISYYVSTNALSMEDISAIEDWKEGTEFTINRGDYEQFVVYAKLENNAGMATYISTDGIIMEAVPVEPETPAVPETPAEPETPTEPETPEVQEPEVEETVTKISGGKVSLKKGTPYQLGDGKWKVAGDETIYYGGMIFYVDEDGDYEFIQE